MNDDITFEREIRTTAVDFSFGELLNLHNDNEIVIRPEYQRLFRWSTEQRSRLIESIILGLPIPPIFLIEGEDGVLELIDGLQRTSSVLQFLDNESIGEPELVLTGCDIVPELNGSSFKKLPLAIRMKVKRAPIRATIINKSGDAFVKYEMFKRLNTGGSMLSAQEIRNCSSRMVEGGKIFYDAIQEMAQYQSFSKAISRLPDNFKERRADEELVIRFFAVTTYKENYKGNIEEWLDSFMEDVLFKKIDFNIKKQRSNFEKVFDLIFEKAEDKAFTRFNDDGQPIGRLAPAYYEAAVSAFTNKYNTIKKMTPNNVIEKLRTAYSTDAFKDATGPGANTTGKLNSRIEVVSNIFN